ncbi:MAG TPA: F0F1 ATP synthase subunit A [Candidatus Binatia bacterium]|nr:F0F1 ATP synthase subunit A [Candidatus Binatia bacterium]
MEHPFTWTYALGMDPDSGWKYFAIGCFVMGVLLLLALRARAAISKDGEAALVPDEGLSARNVFELVVEAIGSLADTVIGDGNARYLPLLCTFFLYILACNAIGLVPGFTPPTSDFAITFALGTVSFIAFNYYGLRQNGVAYLKHFAGPILWLAPLIFTLEMIGAFVRPVSLGLRLYGNLFGDHLVLEIFTELTKVVVPVVFYLLGTLVTVIQAFVFTLLSMIYIALAVAHHEEGHGEVHAH